MSVEPPTKGFGSCYHSHLLLTLKRYLAIHFQALKHKAFEWGGGQCSENRFYEARGKRTGRRVLSVDGGFKVEVSFECTGKLLGVDANEIGTYWSESRADGSLYGEGQGVALAQDGTSATWKGAGVGKFGEAVR